MEQSGLAKQSRMTSMKDFTPERADGRTTKTMAWARKKYADAAKKPAHPFLRDRESFLAWKADYLKKYASYLPWKTRSPAVEFVSEEKRDGFTLCVYECHPYPRAAVRAWVLVPDGVKKGKTPLVCSVCLAPAHRLKGSLAARIHTSRAIRSETARRGGTPRRA